MAWHSPLFREASRAVLAAARQEFARSTTGRLFGEVQRELSRPLTAPHQVRRALERYSGHGVREALRELRGTEFGRFARDVHQYAKGGGEMRRLLNQFLNELGPAGRMIRALTAPSSNELEPLIKLLQAFGYEVLPPKKARRQGEAVTDRGLAAAQELLESMGAEVTWPEERPKEGERRKGRLPFDIPTHDESGQPRRDLPLPMADGPAQRFGVDHPIVTGEMVDATSSNVHSFGYDIESAYLYVRFLGYVRGARDSAGHALRSGPGSLYRYRDVTPEEFLSLYAANSKGNWVWDHLRIRGTWSGHQKDYELVGVMGGYVPRKATVRIDPKTGRLQEWFVQRRVRAIGGGWLTSQYPSEAAGELPWGEIDRGRPDRGTPDRGEPDRG